MEFSIQQTENTTSTLKLHKKYHKTDHSLRLRKPQ